MFITRYSGMRLIKHILLIRISTEITRFFHKTCGYIMIRACKISIARRDVKMINVSPVHDISNGNRADVNIPGCISRPSYQLSRLSEVHSVTADMERTCLSQPTGTCVNTITVLVNAYTNLSYIVWEFLHFLSR